MEIITSRQNPKIKHVVGLRNKKNRTNQGMFCAEGLRELECAIEHHHQPECLFACPELFSKADSHKLLKTCQVSCLCYELPRSLFEYISYREGPDGLLAIFPIWEKSLADLRLSSNPLLLLAEGIEKPGNLGSLIRTSSAVGIDGLILCNTVVDLFSPNTIRASQGLLFSMPIVQTTNEEAYAFLQARTIQILATTPHTDVLYWDKSMTGPTALLMGAEKDGLSDFWLSQADHKIKIPLNGSADSLNVNAAAVAVLYEGLRQRKAS